MNATPPPKASIPTASLAIHDAAPGPTGSTAAGIGFARLVAAAAQAATAPSGATLQVPAPLAAALPVATFPGAASRASSAALPAAARSLGTARVVVRGRVFAAAAAASPAQPAAAAALLATDAPPAPVLPPAPVALAATVIELPATPKAAAASSAPAQKAAAAIGRLTAAVRSALPEATLPGPVAALMPHAVPPDAAIVFTFSNPLPVANFAAIVADVAAPVTQTTGATSPVQSTTAVTTSLPETSPSTIDVPATPETAAVAVPSAPARKALTSSTWLLPAVNLADVAAGTQRAVAIPLVRSAAMTATLPDTSQLPRLPPRDVRTVGATSPAQPAAVLSVGLPAASRLPASTPRSQPMAARTVGPTFLVQSKAAGTVFLPVAAQLPALAAAPPPSPPTSAPMLNAGPVQAQVSPTMADGSTVLPMQLQAPPQPIQAPIFSQVTDTTLPAIMPSAILPQAAGASGLLPALAAGPAKFADPSSAVPAGRPTTTHAAAAPASVAALLTTALPALTPSSPAPNSLPVGVPATSSPAPALAATVAGVTRPATVQPQATQSPAALAEPKPATPTPDKPPAPAPAPAVAGASAAASTVADPVASGPAAPPPAPVAAVAPGTPPSQHSPATQQAAVVVSQLAAQAGSQRVVVQLHPLDLGRIEVSIERTSGGGTHVTLRAEQPETLRAATRPGGDRPGARPCRGAGGTAHGDAHRGRDLSRNAGRRRAGHRRRTAAAGLGPRDGPRVGQRLGSGPGAKPRQPAGCGALGGDAHVHASQVRRRPACPPADPQLRHHRLTRSSAHEQHRRSRGPGSRRRSCG